MKISIIVPVYNVEKYLDRCISSLLQQGLEKDVYEIILVNDGSTDESLNICESWANKYSQIKVISQENKGVSWARNTGIDMARGEYLCFVDADDYLLPDGYSSVISYCDGENDLIRFWPKIIHANTKDEDVVADGKALFGGTGHEFLKRYGLETFCWNYIYRKAFLLGHDLKFVDVIGEDFAFMADVLFANPQVVSLATRIYCYVIRENSITTLKTKEHSRRWVRDLLDTMMRIKDIMETYRDENRELYEKCTGSLEGKMFSAFARMLSSNYSLKEYKRIIRNCQNHKLLPLKHLSGGMRIKCGKLAVNTLVTFPFMYIPAKLLYTRIFYPYVQSVLDRNG